MKRILILAAMLAFPLAAHAAAPIGTSIEPVYKQVKQVAQSAGYMKAGSGERLNIKTISKPVADKPGLVKVTITAKGSGALPGQPQAGRHGVAQATFSLVQEPDGEIATGKKQEGRVFQPLLQEEVAK